MLRHKIRWESKTSVVLLSEPSNAKTTIIRNWNIVDLFVVITIPVPWGQATTNVMRQLELSFDVFPGFLIAKEFCLLNRSNPMMFFRFPGILDSKAISLNREPKRNAFFKKPRVFG